VRVVINGAGIAGPTLAYWLRRTGHDVLLVEKAPALRSGGYVIDFWGVGYDVAEKMGLLPHIHELGYQVREVRFVDRRGRRTGGFAADVFGRMTNGRFTSVRRSDLSAAIYGALDHGGDTLFGDSVVALDEGPEGVCVHFERAEPQQADVVVGADGLHSRVRQLAFGPQSRFEVSLGYHVAAFELDGYQPRDELVYVSHAVPGRQLSRFAMRGDKTLFLFVFRDEYLSALGAWQERDRRQLLAHVFADVGWECPQVLGALSTVPDVYFDRVSQIRMDRWTTGRTALVGDAAACVSLLAGEGTGLAMAEAYVLAAMLHTCGGNRDHAFDRYQDSLQPFLKRKQQSAARFASSFVPATRTGILFRDAVTRLLRVRAFADYFVGRDLRDDLQLPTLAF
jgi:2-polyprenyl-6-methoxyphenol hydroxylase-like FAD-dependent oxidoreductase